MENKSLRRFAAIFVLAAALLLSASCNANGTKQIKSTVNLTNPDDIKVVMTAEVIAEKTIRVSFENKSEYTFMYGNPYTLEYLSDGKWYQVPFEKDGPIFTMEGIILGPADEYAVPNEEGLTLSNTRSDDVRLEGFAKLSKGRYRIVKDVSLLDDEGGPAKATYYLAAEFDL
ncbi:MAG: hypothetical protein J5777_02295 [Clostridiales bacterium]|nr:hypothetical protein [Clostridiales bacterium]